MKRFVLFLLVLVTVGWSCAKKKYPSSVSENAPVFYFKANLNGAPIEMNAGVNNYRMFSSYTQDSNNVYRLVAELKSKDCSGGCANSIKIQVNDYTVSAAGASMKIDSSLRVGAYGYLTYTNGIGYDVSFTSSCNKTAESYLWDFGDGSTSTSANPTHLFRGSGTYQVCLQIKAVNGYVSNVCQTINLGTQGQLNAYVKVNALMGDSVNFDRVQSGGVSPMSYVWDFGDGTYSNLASPTHKYRVSGSYPVSLKIFDNNGNTVKTNYNIVTQRDVSSMAVNYSSNINHAINYASLPSKITVTYYNEQGLEYSSVNPYQPGSSKFEVMEVSNYGMNENNQSTKQLKIKFNCFVYHGKDSININNAEAVIAVAYK